VKAMTFHIEPAVKLQLDALAERKNIAIAEIVRKAIAQYLKRQS
jgi:predicted transcriptional regulator